MLTEQYVDLAAFNRAIGMPFTDRVLVERAMTHRSFVNESSATDTDNERLEFLGDAVLDFVVGEYLFQRFPTMHEGEMTPLRASLVKTKTLADFARALNVGDFLRLGIGEAESGGRDKPATLCAAFEAVVGAMYLDLGLEATRAFIIRQIEPTLKQVRAESLHIDAKSEFQVWAQGRFNITPRYEVIDAVGPDHDKMFTVRVLVGDDEWGRGDGRSKQKAAQAAATSALDAIRAEEETVDG